MYLKCPKCGRPIFAEVTALIQGKGVYTLSQYGLEYNTIEDFETVKNAKGFLYTVEKVYCDSCDFEKIININALSVEEIEEKIKEIIKND